MSYIVDDRSGRRDARRVGRWGRIVALLAVPMMLTVVVVVVATTARVPARPASGVEPPGMQLSWKWVGAQPVPTSRIHGPRRTDGGLARGFSHDELGAAIAAINISTRLTGAVGPAVYGNTARQQGLGDVELTLAAIVSQSSTAAAGWTTPAEFFYRITGGDPIGATVDVAVAARSPQTDSQAGYGAFERTLVWRGGDWKLQLPPTPPHLIPTVAGYLTLGPTGG